MAKYGSIPLEPMMKKTDEFLELLENYSGERKALIEKAYHFACEAHRNQKRKATAEPYAIHCLDVACYLMEEHSSAEVVAAGLLHDVPEDEKYTHTTLEDLEKAGFPEETVAMVSDVTEKDKTLPWQDRKNLAIEHITTCDYDTKLLKCADKLSNIRSMLETQSQLGDAMWQMGFRGGKQGHKNNFARLHDALSEVSGTRTYKKYAKELDKFLKI